MNIGKACAIFEQIESERYTDEEKLLAIREVIEMPTHNGVTKDTILNAFRWLWNYAIEEVTEDDEWRHRHFAKFENGVVYAWRAGCTSWSNVDDNEDDYFIMEIRKTGRGR